MSTAVDVLFEEVCRKFGDSIVFTGSYVLCHVFENAYKDRSIHAVVKVDISDACLLKCLDDICTRLYTRAGCRECTYYGPRDFVPHAGINLSNWGSYVAGIVLHADTGDMEFQRYDIRGHTVYGQSIEYIFASKVQDLILMNSQNVVSDLYTIYNIMDNTHINTKAVFEFIPHIFNNVKEPPRLKYSTQTIYNQLTDTYLKNSAGEYIHLPNCTELLNRFRAVCEEIFSGHRIWSCEKQSFIT